MREMASKKKKPVAAADAAPLVKTPQAAWTTGLATGPVFIDGLSHSLFYLIVATKNSAEKYQVVAVGKFGPDSFKVKFYGCFEDWGFTKGSLEHKFRARSFLSRADEQAGYERYMTDRAGVAAIVHGLIATRGVTVAPVDGIMQAYDIPSHERAEISLSVHPERGGYRPRLPFTPPVLLAGIAANEAITKAKASSKQAQMKP
jgi:hypothetical protein